jgi:hypothetical protein
VRVRAALAATLALAAGCRRAETACFKVQSIQGTEASRSGEAVPHFFAAFVLANPPKDAQALRRAVETHCGKQPAPDAPAYRVQWWVFKETRDTPRTLVVGTGKHDSLDRHQDDLIFDLVAERTECGDFVDGYVFDKGELLARTSDRLKVPGRDAGPPPAWCGRDSRP